MKEIVEGLTIIQAVEPETSLRAEHDEIWAGGDYAEDFNKYSLEQIKKLYALGWDREAGWHIFV
jgi:hypothetical protein